MKPQVEQTEKKAKITGKDFKFPRARKYILASIKDPHLRGLWKRSYIESAVAAEKHRRGKYIDIFSKAPRGEKE